MGDKELPLFDKSYAYDLQALARGVGPDRAGRQQKRSATSRACATSSTSRAAIPKTGEVSPSYAGYFKRDTEYSRLHTDQRIAMISGNKRELDQWVFMFIYDLYSIASELVKDDPNSLYKQLPKIKAPIFLAFGAREPFIPGTPLNGLNDLANDIINPFVEAHDRGRQSAGAQGLSGRGPLHPHRRALRVRARHGRLHEDAARECALAAKRWMR